MSNLQLNELSNPPQNFYSVHEIMKSESEKWGLSNILSKKVMVNDTLSAWYRESLSNSKSEQELLEAIVGKMIKMESESSLYKKKAYFCSLTNALNRNFFNEFAEVFEQKRRNSQIQADKNIYFFSLDLNKFKNINDNFGHQVGDEVLIEFSNRLKKVIREEDVNNFDIDTALENDFFARFGGDEFIGKFELNDDRDALLVKQRIEFIMKQPFLTSKGELPVGVSVGYQKICEDKSVEDIIAEADIKMYEQKRS